MRAFLNSNQKAFPSLKGFSPRRGLSRNTSTSSISNRQLGHKYKPPEKGAVLNIDLIILITDLTYGSIVPRVTTTSLGAITEIAVFNSSPNASAILRSLQAPAQRQQVIFPLLNSQASLDGSFTLLHWVNVAASLVCSALAIAL